jgi:ubiquinone/menaquinone biosynthesis C-methylase UbiE
MVTLFFLFECLLLVLLAFGLLYVIFLFYATVSCVPYVASNAEARRTMLALVGDLEGKRVLELGSGDGRLCIAAAEQGATAHGVELNPVLTWISRGITRIRDQHTRTTFVCANFWHTPLPSDTDVVLLYLFPPSMNKIQKLLESQLKPGTIIVSNAFRFTEMQPIRQQGSVYVYRLP